MSRPTTSTLLLLLFAIIAVVSAVPAVAGSAHADAGAALELDPGTFHKVVQDPTKHVFVMFYAPWCTHCVRMKPKWEEFARSMADQADVVIAKIDAAAHRAIAEEYRVQGFPTLKLFTKGNKEGVPYQGPRDVAALTGFLKSFMV
ncbi:Thioredoxin domain [Trypanosoma melophagium]|uniref:Thioredoxin domain n=1 Tax=Trypanosoma melophagium TaxID=715481 RepID=UPI00351A9240|nr:Thioredoxin domain [Trypanosoma melophagium]